MSQPLVTAYFNARKRHACDDLLGKSKVPLLDSDNLEQAASNEKTARGSPRMILRDASTAREEDRTGKAMCNIHFDSPTTENIQQSRPRATCNRNLPSAESQLDICDSLQKMDNENEAKKVPFEKKGALSPRKPTTPSKSSSDAPKETIVEEDEQLPAGTFTPTREASRMEMMANMSLEEIKNKINKSSRLTELRGHIARMMNSEQRLQEWQKRNNIQEPRMQKFEKIELEVPGSPQKRYKSSTKMLLTKTKSPVRCSPAKKAYRKYLFLAEITKNGLPLPHDYRFLAEVFRSVDTVSAMLFNKKDLITFNKLKPAVQELLQCNFTLEHLAQIKTIYPDAYTYHQEKCRNFGLDSKQEKYELVLTPVVEANNGRNTPNVDNVLKSASESDMGPAILLDRRRKFYDVLLERVKDEHEKFLQNLETPMNISKEKIMHWHPNFDVELCKAIEQAELPQPPHAENTTAKNVLDKVKSLFKCGTRMEKALQRLAEANLISKSTSPSFIQNPTTQIIEDNIRKVDITIVGTPPTTPRTRNSYVNLFKGTPKALLQKIRAKQAAKALEIMTRTPSEDKEAILYSRLPDLARTLHNIFVTEKRGVLLLETVIQKMDNSFRTKLMPHEIEQHIRLLGKLLPIWISIHNIRKTAYLKLDRNADAAKMIRQLEDLAKNKIKT